MIEAPSDEVRQRDLDGVDGADQVGVDHVDPGRHVRGALHARDSGRRDDDVELAQLGDAVVERRLQLAAVATSTFAVTTRWPVFSTNCAVSSRSSGVAIG